MLKALVASSLLIVAVVACTPAAAPVPGGQSAAPTAESPASPNIAAPSSASVPTGAEWDMTVVVSPVLGDPAAKVTVEEYADYQ